MFYPVDSLRRGGRFYLLWLADSYPTRFSLVSQRSLWSQDIRKLCDELRVTVLSESGRPTHRYSLRLSSQLLRGLVRLYQKKVNGLLNELCMFNANIIKQINKKYNLEDKEPTSARPRLQEDEHRSIRRATTRPTGEPRVEEEQRIEEILQTSGNVVANIQDITLKETALPENILPPNDGFGEENPDQALNQLIDRTIEMMMNPTDQTVQRSALDLATLDITDRTHDLTRPPAHADMERMSAHDLTLMRPSLGGQLPTDFEKEIPELSDIPLLPIPELPVPQDHLVDARPQQQPDVEMREVPVETTREERPTSHTMQQSLPLELEELEAIEPRPRKQRRLIIDKTIKISDAIVRARIANPKVELRCEDFHDMIADIQVPLELYMNRPCRAGYKERSYIAPTLTRLYMRNLGFIPKSSVDRELEEGVMQRAERPRTRPDARPLIEVEIPPEIPIPELEKVQEITLEENLVPQVDLSKDAANEQDIVTEKEQDIENLPTQKLQMLSQRDDEQTGVKRPGDEETTSKPKRRSQEQPTSVRSSQRQQPVIEVTAAAEPENQHILDMEIDKENIPANIQSPLKPITSIQKPIEQRRLTTSNLTTEQRVSDANQTIPHEGRVSQLLHEAGLTEPGLPPQDNLPLRDIDPNRARRRPESEDSSETPLGSLDRTKVSLGDSDKTTESTRFIREEWSTERTMLKIIRCVQLRRRGERITVQTLIDKGPILHNYKNIIKAKCFSSILKLKQNGFIKITKSPETLEILDISIGPKLGL